MTEDDKLFLETGQDRIKLRIAMDKIFGDEVLEASMGTQYLQYIKRRIRPVVEALIRTGQIDQMNRIIEWGFVTAENIDEFIGIARRSGRPEATAFLLNYKRQNFGFEEQEFLL